ncbi:MAG: trypsin-like peptidase domain-containing protein [Clostridia bacterium]
MENNCDESEVLNLIKETKHKCIKICVIIVVISMLVNLLIFTVFKSSLANKITKSIAADIESRVTAQVTDDVLKQYKREYKIADDATTIGTFVYANESPSVVEVYCESTGRKSMATGMIVNAQGYVLTNAHVVTYEESAGGFFGPTEPRTVEHSKVYIRLKNEEKWRDCKIITYDEKKDLAIIKLQNINNLSLQAIKYGDSNQIVLGEGAVIIGNAFGLGISVTTGTITNINPKNLGDSRDVIQTDTAINSGNSGGPIFDITGSCIGVATYKIVNNTSGGGNASTEGLGFALSSNFTTAFLKANGISYTLSA